jgi:rhodanese-related sulfurtransferase
MYKKGKNIMKKFTILLLISFIFLGCMQKKIFVQSREERPVVYTQAPIVYEESRPRYESSVIVEESASTLGQSYAVEPGEAYDMILSDPFVIVLDVRMPEEQKHDGKIANSILIPLPYLRNNLHKLDKSKKILVYCHTGNRSREAVRLLSENGFEAINLNGGIAKWKAEHLSVKY